MLVPRASRLSLLAVGEYLAVLPATVFMAAAVLRLLQPRQYEPAHTSWLIFNWTTTHISRLGAAALFIGLPALVAVAGAALLSQHWKANHSFRNDISLFVSILRRNVAVGLVLAGALLGAAILAFSVLHVVTD